MVQVGGRNAGRAENDIAEFLADGHEQHNTDVYGGLLGIREGELTALSERKII